MNAYLLLEIAASIVPDQEVITFGEERQTYAQLVDNTSRLAAALHEAGVRQGDRIGLVATNHPAVIEVFFATFQLGATVVPINYRAKQEELSYMIEDAGVKLLFLEDRYRELITPMLSASGMKTAVTIGGEADQNFRNYEQFKQSQQPYEGFADVESADLAVILYTSGTTSRPKGVMLTYGQLTTYVMNHSEVADGTDRGSSVVCIPIYHVAGTTSVCNAIYTGRRLILLSQFDAEKWLHAVEHEKANHAFLVPTMLKQVMDHPRFDQTDLSSLESLSYGAAPMPLPVILKAIEKFPETTGFANAFGMTETTSTVSVLGPDDHKLTGNREEREKKIQRLSSVGKPLPGVEIIVLDDNNQLVGPNVVGNVYVRTERAMKGYWNRPEASKETLVDGWVNTEDVGWLDEEGYLFLGGRSSDMIIRGGENISPAEIEDVFLQHPNVSDVAVIGVPSLEWGEEIMAVVVVDNPDSPPASEELNAFCRERLASFKVPANILFADTLPRTSTGKILKRELRERYTPVNETTV
ncbi:long-chain-fatty-acid--CoA ligase [Sporosarcina sp. 179-K 3D1 HS]|uniref:class I adenylate-forming enzyme family protein n=1 Tax=Sporosarcina sp. 179-K 3D1 HS TaxID=3232169 RepID=UPI0039A00219